MACRRSGIFCSAIMTRLQRHEQSSAELTQCCKLRPRELKSRLLEQRVLKLHELPIQKLVKALLVKFDTHVKAAKASKHEIITNAYKLGYLDCRNSASPCCSLEHEDEAVEEQIADEAAMEEDNSRGGVADKARPDAKEQAGEAAPLSLCFEDQLVYNGDKTCRLRAYVGDIMLEKDSIEFVLQGVVCLQWR
ncbi:unnamed protein product [Prunus brigantina]